MELEVGQVVEFFRPVQFDGRRIEKGTRARIVYILAEVLDPKVTLIPLGSDKPEPLTLERPLVTLNSIPVSAPA